MNLSNSYVISFLRILDVFLIISTSFPHSSQTYPFIYTPNLVFPYCLCFSLFPCPFVLLRVFVSLSFCLSVPISLLINHDLCCLYTLGYVFLLGHHRLSRVVPFTPGASNGHSSPVRRRLCTRFSFYAEIFVS